ncbi:MAG: hypothetical protein N4A33_01790 [Bacteriovoracaceae bacterium]|jgi:3-hydroxyacyl-[acyl-carrier-protein] dehydratase|nr:hypothetical protein [Bacteriovoracaceae bacterium]
MDIEQIKKLLHHREPYLMVSKVISCSENKIETIKTHTNDEAHIKGHFPGAPIVPGAMLQEMCTQSAGILLTKFHCPVDNYDSEVTKGHAIGVLRRVEKAKYSKIVKPHISIEARVELKEQVEDIFSFKAKVFQNNEKVASLSFSLINTSDSILF